jgi:hypothetical protein
VVSGLIHTGVLTGGIYRSGEMQLTDIIGDCVTPP